MLLFMILVTAGGAARADVVARGSDFAGLAGIHAGSGDTLWVTSVPAGAIYRLSRDGRVLEIVAAQNPDDLCFDPAGVMYYTEPFLGWVMKWDGATTTQVGSGMPTVNPIACSPDGRVFAAGAQVPALWEIDPSGLAPPRLVSATAGPFNSMGFGADAQLYAPRWLNGAVVRVDLETGAFTQMNTDPLITPIAVHANPRDGNLYVLDQARATVYRLDLGTGRLFEYARGSSTMLDSFAFTEDGTLYTTSAADGVVEKLSRRGSPEQITTPGMIMPSTVFVTQRWGIDLVHVADVFSVRTFLGRLGFELRTAYGTFGAPGGMIPAATAFGTPRGLWVLSNTFFNFVQVWDPENNTQVAFDQSYSFPTNAIEFAGELVVSEAGSGNVVVGAAHTPVLSGLFAPAGLSGDSDAAYVSDLATGIVWQFAAGGSYLASPRVIATGLAGPEGLAIDRDGTVLVVESAAGRLTRIDPTTGAKSTIVDHLATGLPFANVPPWFPMAGVAVADAGEYYVTGDRGRLLYRVH